MAGRALVLGGGGVTGVAWEVGLLAGLAERGVDLTQADLVVGTSAGSLVGAQVTSGVSLRELYAAQLAPPTGEFAARIGASTMLRWAWAVVRSRDPVRARARIGRLALATKTEPEANRREVFEARVPVREWPRQRLLITAVMPGSGEFNAFDAASGAGLVDAVSASCAVPGVWPPVTIGGRRWMDGGVRSAANADLAARCGTIVVLAPISAGFGPMPALSAQVAELRKRAAVAVVSPDHRARRTIGRHMLTRRGACPLPARVMPRPQPWQRLWAQYGLARFTGQVNDPAPASAWAAGRGSDALAGPAPRRRPSGWPSAVRSRTWYGRPAARGGAAGRRPRTARCRGSCGSPRCVHPRLRAPGGRTVRESPARRGGSCRTQHSRWRRSGSAGSPGSPNPVPATTG